MLQNIFKVPRLILNGKGWIWSKQSETQISNWEKNSNFDLEQIRNSKITFDFSKQLEKLPTWKLFNFLRSTTFMLATFQNSN